jgi:hypothetical protein
MRPSNLKRSKLRVCSPQPGPRPVPLSGARMSPSADCGHRSGMAREVVILATPAGGGVLSGAHSLHGPRRPRAPRAAGRDLGLPIRTRTGQHKARHERRRWRAPRRRDGRGWRAMGAARLPASAHPPAQNPALGQPAQRRVEAIGHPDVSPGGPHCLQRLALRTRQPAAALSSSANGSRSLMTMRSGTPGRTPCPFKIAASIGDRQPPFGT